MSKNVAVFVDVANIFYAAKAAGVDIDYVTLLKAATAGRDFVRAYAYTGLDPENENQRNFHSFLARHGYKVVSKDIRKYGDGKVKANLDIELVVDMMKTARNLDVAIVVSGDGDFAPAIRAVQEMGVRVEVISFRGNTSSDLIEVADVFNDITQLAQVDRDSSRSGRRVAGDDEDLSMTEVPDKQTEGRGGRRGRGRGRGGRGEGVDEVAAAEAAARACRPRARQPRRRPPRHRRPRSGGRLVALPGEKLSRAAGAEAKASRPRTRLSTRRPRRLVEAPEAEAPRASAEAAAPRRTGRRRRRPRRSRPWPRPVARAAGEAGEIGEGDVAEPEEGEDAGPAGAAPESVRVGVGLADRHGRSAGAARADLARTRTTTPSRRSPSTCWPSVAAAADGRGGGGRAGRPRSAQRLCLGRGARALRPIRRRRAMPSRSASRSRSRSGDATSGRSAPAPAAAAASRRRDAPQRPRLGRAVERGSAGARGAPASPALDQAEQAGRRRSRDRPAGRRRRSGVCEAAEAAEAKAAGQTRWAPQAGRSRRGGRRAEPAVEAEAPVEKAKPASRGRRKPAEAEWRGRRECEVAAAEAEAEPLLRRSALRLAGRPQPPAKPCRERPSRPAASRPASSRRLEPSSGRSSAARP